VADPEAEGQDTRDLALLLWDTALLNSGFNMEDPKDFAGRMYRLMRTGLQLDNLDLLPQLEVAVEEEEAPAAEEGEEGEDAGEAEDGDADKQEL